MAGTQEGLELGPREHAPGWEGVRLEEVQVELGTEGESITGGSGSHSPPHPTPPTHLESLDRAAKGLAAHLPLAHSPDSTALPPEGVGGALGELVQVSAVLPLREECAQLRVHVAEDEGQFD